MHALCYSYAALAHSIRLLYWLRKCIFPGGCYWLSSSACEYCCYLGLFCFSNANLIVAVNQNCTRNQSCLLWLPNPFIVVLIMNTRGLHLLCVLRSSAMETDKTGEEKLYYHTWPSVYGIYVIEKNSSKSNDRKKLHLLALHSLVLLSSLYSGSGVYLSCLLLCLNSNSSSFSVISSSSEL